MIQDGRDNHGLIGHRIKDVAKIEEALTVAGRKAVAEHFRAGRKIPVWQDGCVVWVESQSADGSEWLSK